MPATRPLWLAAFVVLVFWCTQWTLIEFSSTAVLSRSLESRNDSHRFALRASKSIPDVNPVAESLERCASHRSSEKTSFVDYESLVYCTRLGDSLPWARTVLVVLLVVLLYLLSSTADSFFCPALQAIVEKYRIPPDIAGVTFLSFGNGSPDVFSNIAAFSTSTPKIGVTSILGGGLLVTTVIVASVGLASQDQDQLIPRKFVRDVVFYFIAIAYLCFVFFDGLVHLTEALGFLALYLCYVTVILLDRPLARLYYSIMAPQYEEVEEFDPRKHLRTWSFLSSASRSRPGSDKSNSSENGDEPPTIITAYDVFRIPHYAIVSSDSEQSETGSLLGMPTLYRKSSAPTPRATNPEESGYDTSSPREVSMPSLWRQLTPARRPASVCVPSLARRKHTRKRTAWESTQLSAHYNLTAKRWTRGYHELSGIDEFPSVSEMGDRIEEDTAEEQDDDRESILSMRALSRAGDEAPSMWERYLFRWFRVGYGLFEQFVWVPLEFSTTFLRRLTIPLIDDETWDKTFAMVCPPCSILLVGVSIFELNPLKDLTFAVVAVVGGAAGSAFVYCTASPLTPPEGALLAPYICLAFVMSVIWIMNIANEVLALLKVLGGLFGLSNSVLGVSVLAWGNSIGDLVSNTSIARDGFPTMAFAGCFAGPMFNLLVGIGLAMTIAIISRGPISMGEPSPLVYVGFAFLFASLLLNLAFAALDGFRYRPRLCYTLLVLRVLCRDVDRYHRHEPRVVMSRLYSRTRSTIYSIVTKIVRPGQN